LVTSFGQPREELHDLAEGPGAWSRGCDKVFPHCQIRKTAATFRHQSNSKPRYAVRPHANDGMSIEADRARAGAHQAKDGFDRGGLAHAVAAHKRDHFALHYLQAYAEKRL